MESKTGKLIEETVKEGSISPTPSRGLHVRGIRKNFGGVEVLRGVDFAVEPGEFVTLLGPSGCGKTTLLRIIAGLEIADAGAIELGGQSIGDLPAQKRPVNIVFQSYALFPHLSVLENVAFGLRSRKFPQSEVRDRVDRSLSLLQLESFSGRHPHQLSGGQKQRVALARALVNEPEALLLDEPMSALDAQLRAEVQLELRRLQRRLGKSFLLVTHDQNEAMTVSDRIIVMRDGRIEQIGAPGEVYGRPDNRFVAQFLGAANLIPATRNGNSPSSVITPFGPLVLKSTPPWDEGTLSIRPERIVVNAEKSGANFVDVVIRETIYRGDHLDLFVEPGPLRIRTTPNFRIGAGETIRIELPAENLHPLKD